MKNDVSNLKLHSKDETTCLFTNPTNNADYSTIAEKSMEITSTTTNFDLYKGFIYMFLSCFLKSLYSILCKVELERNSSMSCFHLLSLKSYFMLCITVSVALYYFFTQGYNRTSNNIYIFSKGSLNMLVLRSILCVVSMSLTLFALKYISISEVYSVYYVYPVFVVLLSYFMLREKVGAFDYLCLISCFIGGLLIIRPEFIFPDDNQAHKANMLMFIFVLFGALLKAFEDIIIRNVGKEVNCLIVPSIYSLIAIVLYPVPLGFSANVSDAFTEFNSTDCVIVLLIAIFSFGYQALMTLSIQSDNAGRVSMINYLQVFFMFLSDLFIFQRKIVFLDVLGTALILSFNMVNGIQKVMIRIKELRDYKNKVNLLNTDTKYIAN